MFNLNRGFISFPWGLPILTHRIGNMDMVQYKSGSENRFHPYVNGEDTNKDYFNLDCAILGALGFKYDGSNSQFDRFASFMLRIP